MGISTQLDLKLKHLVKINVFIIYVVLDVVGLK